MFGATRLVVSPAESFPTGITMLWATFNVFILLAAMGTLFERRQRRATPRMPIAMAARVKLGKKFYTAEIRDLSINGCGLGLDPAYESLFVEGSELELTIPGNPKFAETPIHIVVRNARREPGILFVGGQFEHTSLEEMKLKVFLVNGNSQRWVDFQTTRERRIGVVRSAIFLLTLGVRYSLQHFGHVMLVAHSKRTGKSFKTSTQSV